jgi:hypothetical protein
MYGACHAVLYPPCTMLAVEVEFLDEAEAADDDADEEDVDGAERPRRGGVRMISDLRDRVAISDQDLRDRVATVCEEVGKKYLSINVLPHFL